MHYLTHVIAMPAEAEVAAIQQVGAVAVAALSLIGAVLVAILNRNRQHAKATRADVVQMRSDVAVVRNEVKNDHDTNLRDENDERHDVVIKQLDQILTVQRAQAQALHSMDRGLGGVRDDVRQLRHDLEDERDRIRRLEDTRPKEQS